MKEFLSRCVQRRTRIKQRIEFITALILSHYSANGYKVNEQCKALYREQSRLSRYEKLVSRLIRRHK